VAPPEPPAATRRSTTVVVAVVACVVVLGLAALAAVVVSRHGSSGRVAPVSGLDGGSAAPRGVVPTTGLPQAVEQPGPPELRTTNPSGPVVTPAQAKQITATIFQLRAAALAAQDRPAFQRIDTGVALESDIPACGCLGERFGAITDMSAFVPRQSSYPASFMAEVATTNEGTPSIENMVVVRRSAADSWRLAVENVVTFPSGQLHLDAPVADAGGYDAAPTMSPATSATLFRELATYWQSWKNTGAAPSSSPFDANAFTTGKGAELAAHRQDQLQDNGLYGHYEYAYDPGDVVYTFAVDGGWSVSCSAVRHATLFTPRRGQLAVQDAARHNWGPTLAPGTYDALTENHVEQSCIFVPTNGRGLPFVAGDTNAVVSVTPSEPG
jgi:hypothetical protein